MIFPYYVGHVITLLSLGFIIQCHPNTVFPFEEEKNRKLFFLDVEVPREGNKFIFDAYQEPTFSGVYTYFDRFLPITYKFGRIYTLAFNFFHFVLSGITFIMS